MKFSRTGCRSNVKPSRYSRLLHDGFRVQLKLTTMSRDEDGSVQNWNDIAVLLPGRTNKDCRKRWSKIQVNIRKGPWTQDEDERLQQAVQQIGVKLVAPLSHSWSCNLVRIFDAHLVPFVDGLKWQYWSEIVTQTVSEWLPTCRIRSVRSIPN